MQPCPSLTAAKMTWARFYSPALCTNQTSSCELSLPPQQSHPPSSQSGCHRPTHTQQPDITDSPTKITVSSATQQYNKLKHTMIYGQCSLCLQGQTHNDLWSMFSLSSLVSCCLQQIHHKPSLNSRIHNVPFNASCFSSITPLLLLLLMNMIKILGLQGHLTIKRPYNNSVLFLPRAALPISFINYNITE